MTSETGETTLNQSNSVRRRAGRVRRDIDEPLQMAVVIAVAVIVLVLAVGGLLAFLYNSENAKDLWVIIGPIISAVLSGFIAFLIGKRYGAATKQEMP